MAFRWRFFNNKQKRQTSDVFVVGGIEWAICIKQEPFRLCLQLAKKKDVPPRVIVRARVSLTLVNELSRSESVLVSTKDGRPAKFSRNNAAIAFKVPVPLAVLYKRGGGFCTDDGTYTVEADVHVHGPSEPSLATGLSDELVQFMDFGLIEKAFVPLLEEVCSFRPSLIECLGKVCANVRLCALGALGQLLHFLKTTKGKDMTEDACARLRDLWHSVEIFKFDVTWLKPSVECALNMNKSLDQVRRVKRLRNDVEAYEKETKKWSEALETAKRKLVEEEARLVEVDLDSVLGYQMQ